MMTDASRCSWAVVALGVIAVACDVVRADESLVWELKPYRIQVLLVPDWAPEWSDQRLATLGRAVSLRARAEIGRPWILDVQAASLPVRRSVLSSKSPERWVEFSRQLAPYRDQDKVVLVLLSDDSGWASAVAWELDWASRRWAEGKSYRAAHATGLEQAVFESIDSVVSPVAQVTLASGQRVVLRQRGALLPIRNQRRATVDVGSVFEVVRRSRKFSTPAPEDATLLVVDEISERGVVCRIASRDENPVEGSSLSDWIAVLTRVQHAGTRFQLTRSDGDSEIPLTECEVWVADQISNADSFVGRPDTSGEIEFPAAHKVQRLKVKVGAVTLREYRVLPGVTRHQTIPTQITSAQLQHVSLLATSCDDVAQLLSVQNTYLARYQHRLDAGRDDSAKKLWEEMQQLLKEEARVQLETIRQRRNEAVALDPNEAKRCAAQWSELIGALNTMESAEPSSDPEAK